jgi:hypothetical protein
MLTFTIESQRKHHDEMKRKRTFMRYKHVNSYSNTAFLLVYLLTVPFDQHLQQSWAAVIYPTPLSE